MLTDGESSLEHRQELGSCIGEHRWGANNQASIIVSGPRNHRVRGRDIVASGSGPRCWVNFVGERVASTNMVEEHHVRVFSSFLFSGEHRTTGKHPVWAYIIGAEYSSVCAGVSHPQASHHDFYSWDRGFTSLCRGFTSVRSRGVCNKVYIASVQLNF